MPLVEDVVALRLELASGIEVYFPGSAVTVRYMSNPDNHGRKEASYYDIVAMEANRDVE